MVTKFYTKITAKEPLVDLQATKQHLRIEETYTEEDDLIKAYSEAAQVASENYVERMLDENQLVLEVSGFETVIFDQNYINDVVEKVEYYPLGSATLTVLPPERYYLSKSITVDSWDLRFKPLDGETKMPDTAKRDDAVIVTVKRGFTVATCPKAILSAIKLKIADLYEKREDRQQAGSSASENLLRPYRKY